MELGHYPSTLVHDSYLTKTGKQDASVRAVHSYKPEFPAFTKAGISAIMAAMLQALVHIIIDLLKALLVEALASRVRRWVRFQGEHNIKDIRLVLHRRHRGRLLNSLSTDKLRNRAK